MDLAEIVQPDHRQVLLARSLARSDDLTCEAAGQPLWMPMAAVELAQHERGVPDEAQGQEAPGRSGAAERCHGARVEVDHPGLSCLGRALLLPGEQHAVPSPLPSAAWVFQDARSVFEVVCFQPHDDAHPLTGAATAVEDGQSWIVDQEIRVDVGWRRIPPPAAELSARRLRSIPR